MRYERYSSSNLHKNLRYQKNLLDQPKSLSASDFYIAPIKGQLASNCESAKMRSNSLACQRLASDEFFNIVSP
jgi:hypothetical protein